jgi:succinoglycan biosynthesis protein ExoM
LKLCVLIVTRRRPQMLAALLFSLQRLNPVDDCQVEIVIVDTDEHSGARDVAANASRRGTDRPARYIEAPLSGLSAARNRALDEAETLGVDLCVFIDDDQTADPAWLAELVATYRKRALQLIGGPVRAVHRDDVDALTDRQRTIFEGVEARYSKIEARAARKTAAGKDDDIVITTNNWMIDFQWWKQSGLRFDETLDQDRDSDISFFMQARKIGVKSGWCPTAIVSQDNPAVQLSFAYQYGRARAEALSEFRRKYPSPSIASLPATLIISLAKSIAGAACLLATPIFGGSALVESARALGWISGRFAAMRGKTAGR